MNRTLIATVGSAAFLAAMMFGGPAKAQPATPQPTAAPTAQNARREGERHPEIEEALRHLEEAKRNMEKGAHDFGGHRAKALDLTNQAIDQLHEALRYDRK